MNIRIPMLVVCALVARSAVASAQMAPADTGALMVSAVQEPPAVLPNSCQAPQYPATMRVAGLEGRVVFRFVVDQQGNVEPTSIQVVNATHSAFEAPARRAIMSCRYRAARFNDQTVRVVVQAPVEFRMTRRS